MGICEKSKNDSENNKTKDTNAPNEQIKSNRSPQNIIQANNANNRIQDSKIKENNESKIIKDSNISKKICKIKIETQIGNKLETKIFTGFFLKFNIDQDIHEYLVSNAHIITKDLIDINKIIYISYDNEMKGTSIKLNGQKRYIKNFKDFGLDITVVEIKEDDNVLEDYFLFPNEENIINENLINSKIFIINFQNGGELINEEGIIKNIKNYEFTYLVNKNIGLSGGPIFLENTSEVIGIHKESKSVNSENYADFIYPVINFIREDIRKNKGKNINGKYIYEDGNYYEGELKNNIPNGRGIKYSSKGEKIYEGDFINGKFHGNGEYIWENGDFYKGQWKNGLKHGKGTLYFNDGNIVYEGDYINDSAARIKEEFDYLVNNPITNCGIQVTLIKKGDYSRWKGSIMGGKDTLYKGGIFFYLIEFPPTYPQNPPKICFLTPIYHVNINPKKPKFPHADPLGNVNLSTLNWWKPEYKMSEILINLFGLFYIANPDSSYSLEMADELRNNRNLYNEKIEYFTKKYASSVDSEKFFDREHDWDFTYP